MVPLITKYFLFAGVAIYIIHPKMYFACVTTRGKSGPANTLKVAILTNCKWSVGYFELKLHIHSLWTSDTYITSCKNDHNRSPLILTHALSHSSPQSWVVFPDLSIKQCSRSWWKAFWPNFCNNFRQLSTALFVIKFSRLGFEHAVIRMWKCESLLFPNSFFIILHCAMVFVFSFLDLCHKCSNSPSFSVLFIPGFLFPATPLCPIITLPVYRFERNCTRSISMNLHHSHVSWFQWKLRLMHFEA